MTKEYFILVFLSLFNFHYSSGSDFTSSAFGSRIHVQPAAFGDFNSDELTDLFVISNVNNVRSVEILLGSTKEPYFTVNPHLRCNHTGTVTSIVPGDFDGDALMDMLVTVRPNDTGDNGQLHVYIHWGEYDGTSKINCSTKKVLTTWDEPLAITYRTDLRTDIFAVDPNSEHHARYLYRFSKNNSKPEPTILTDNSTKMKYPHSHAFLDLNEDNYADLLFTTVEGCEVWIYDDGAHKPFKNDSDLDFKYMNGYNSKKVGQTLFIDLESNDKTYVLLPLIKPSSIWAYSFESTTWYDLNVNFIDPDKNKWSFDYEGAPYHYLDIPTLRAGDFNNDGFVDLLATLRCSGNKCPSTNFKTFLLENSPCQTYCEYLKRTYVIQWTALSPNNENAVMGVFFDFMQDGILDVIFVKVDDDKKHYVSAYKNSLDYDANFIKVMVISGIENSNVQMPAFSILGKKHLFGSNLPGPKIHYRTTNQDGVAQYGRTCQLAQSAHFALYLPYTIFGLGRTPNFVEDLIVGMFNRTKQFSPIIPNSQLVIKIPDTDAKNPSKWRAQLFVTPSKIIWQTVFALTGTCIVLIIIIGALHWKERREDKFERLQESQRFHYDAM